MFLIRYKLILNTMDIFELNLIVFTTNDNLLNSFIQYNYSFNDET